MSAASDFVGKELPPSWSYRPVSTITNFSTGFTPPTSNETYYGNDFFWANISDLGGGKYISTTAKGITTTGKQLADGDPLPVGTLLFSFKLSVGLTAITAAPMYTNEAIAAFPPSPYLDTSYGYYALPVFIPLEAATNIYGAPILNAERIKRARVPLPPLKTQRRIADYLDRETGQIDETIARIDRVVDLIEERRARLHRDAFSENHPTTSLVTIAEITLGKMLDQKNTVGDPTEYLRAANVRKDGTIDLTDTKQMLMTEDERKRYELQAGDILMVEGGDAGRVALLPDDLPGLAIQKTLMRIRINDTVANPAYCYLWIDHLHKSGVLALDYSVSTIAHFTAEKAQRIRIPLPPLEVQKQTAKNLQAHNLEVEEMVNQASRLKSLLEERRSALITAAVTGRIEV